MLLSDGDDSLAMAATPIWVLSVRQLGMTMVRPKCFAFWVQVVAVVIRILRIADAVVAVVDGIVRPLPFRHR